MCPTQTINPLLHFVFQAVIKTLYQLPFGYLVMWATSDELLKVLPGLVKISPLHMAKVGQRPPDVVSPANWEVLLQKYSGHLFPSSDGASWESVQPMLSSIR